MGADPAGFFIVGWGVMTTTLFSTCGRFLTALFVPEEPIVTMGAEYLRFLAFCQIAFCVEAVAAGAFRGLGRTVPPSVVSILTNGLRVPVVHLLSSTGMGLNGIWAGITLTAFLRGVCMAIWFFVHLRSRPRENTRSSVRSAASSAASISGRLLP